MVCEFDACPDHDGPCIPWAGKPVLTCGIAVEHTSGSATMGVENDSGLGAARTARGLDGRPKEAPAVDDDTPFFCAHRICPRCTAVDDDPESEHPADGLAGPCGRCGYFEWWANCGSHMDGRCPTTATEQAAWARHDLDVLHGRAD